MNRHTPLSAEILDRIRNSVLESRISMDHAQFLDDQGLIDS
jgi:hypothetical protein